MTLQADPGHWRTRLIALVVARDRGASLLIGGRVLQLLNSFCVSIVLVRQYGLATVGVFAVGFIAMSVLSLIGTLGLPSYLPRLEQPLEQSATIAISLQALVAPLWLLCIGFYVSVFSRGDAEGATIALVSAAGIMIAITNCGLTLSIMGERYAPGLIAPALESVCILGGVVFARTPTGLAGWLLLGRTSAAISTWAHVRFAPVARRDITQTGLRAMSYLVPDGLGMLSEQSAAMILAALLTRSELGVFRLCQQLLTAADTPGWSYVQAHYPKLARDPEGIMAWLAKRVDHLAIIVALGGVVGAIALSVVLHVPEMAPMCLVLMLTLVLRYRNNLYDQGLRASGRVRISSALGAIKVGLGVALSVLLASLFGVWGGVVAVALLSLVAGVLYKRAFYSWQFVATQEIGV